jgi:RNAse (barnase) inhibitor barstar
MKANPLLLPKGPWLHVLVATESETWDRMLALQQSTSPVVAARRIRGHKAMTSAALFDEFAAALQFPYYFGENWDAFHDCLHDLEWLPGKAYTLFLANSNRLLEKESQEELHLFLGLLASAGEEWAKQGAGERPRSAKAFHAVLHCSLEEETALRRRLQAVPTPFDSLK